MMVEATNTKRLNRAKAIRQKCLDCCMDQPAEVRECPITRCPLWRYRMGKEEHDKLYYESRKHKGESTDEGEDD